MRTLDELGISPAPWTLGSLILDFEGRRARSSVDDANEETVAGDLLLKEADARLIASAPELYEALRELVKVTLETYWDRYWRGCEVAKERVNKAVENAKAALAAANGESEKGEVK